MDYSIANTHIWPHAGKLYALMEGCPPVAMDPDSLETLGSETFGGAAAGPFTAHPKTCPTTGDLHAFGYSAKGPASTAIRYNIIDARGRPTHTTFLDQPYCSMMHDFMMTENYVIFPCMPVVIDMARAMRGGPMAAWEGNRTSYFGIMPKGGTAADLRWVESDPCFMFHSANAFERGDEIVIDVAGDAACAVDARRRWQPADARGIALCHATLGGRQNRACAPKPSTPSTCSSRASMIAARAAPIAPPLPMSRHGRPPAESTASTCSHRIDVETGGRDSFDAGDGAYLGEPVFVPNGAD